MTVLTEFIWFRITSSGREFLEYLTEYQLLVVAYEEETEYWERFDEQIYI